MNEEIEKLGEIITKLIGEQFQNKNHKSMLYTSICSLLLFKFIEDMEKYDDAELALLHYMHISIERILDISNKNSKQRTPSRNSCSFCDQRPPKVRLGAGPGVFICNECVNTFSKIL